MLVQIMARAAFPIVLSAPSGAGKTTLANLLIKNMSDVKLSISYTTRKKRGSERENVDYFFVDDAKFDAMIAQNLFLEWAKVHSCMYGSPLKETNETLNSACDVLFDIDVQGGIKIKEAFPKALLIFICAPSWIELENRLRKRGTESDEIISKRLFAAQQELKIGVKSYDYILSNKTLSNSLFELTRIVHTHRILNSAPNIIY